MNMEQAREYMIERQVRTWEVLDPMVLDAMRAVPREDFVPAKYRTLAFADEFIPLGHGEVMLTPKLEGRILQTLDLGARDSVLEVGCGSGYFAACLAVMTDHVLSVELHEDFLKPATAAIETIGLANVELAHRDSSRLEWTEERFDVIVLSGSVPELHPSFTEHLKIGGRLFAVIGAGPTKEATLFTRVSANSLARESVFDTDIPPLRNLPAGRPFEL